MESKENYERMLRECAYEDAVEAAEVLIAEEKFESLNALVNAAANQNMVSLLNEIAEVLFAAGEDERGAGVAILAACVGGSDDRERGLSLHEMAAQQIELPDPRILADPVSAEVLGNEA